MSKNKRQPDGLSERRIIAIPVTLERRADEDGESESRRISGYAAVFNQKTRIGNYFEEEIMPGAFDECDFSRCVLNFNHDDNILLGRTSSGTLSLDVDEKGLRFEADLPNTTHANDILELIRRGDIEGCSFAFVVRESAWEWLSDEDPAQLDLRKIVKISDVFDVSVVTHPAYEQTSVDARSAEADREDHKRAQEAARAEQTEFEKQRREREFQLIQINSYA
ncbi:MAG: HK97 family phage prohead protease [Bacteroidales bacterium]|nr:HK97 family phage prohead protease [Bacteroidales bacterium]MBP5689286.1 HK97 family phage prohead protease [Bacteroidales bacterium]